MNHLFRTLAGLGLSLILFASMSLLTSESAAYPLDGEAQSGLRRLPGDLAAGRTAVGGRWPTEAISLHMLEHATVDFDQQPMDPYLVTELTALLENRDPSYGVALVDFTDPQRLRWAGLRADLPQNPGSVGKIVCMLALFDALARAFPDVNERARVLRESVIYAGDWVLPGEHKVPRFQPDTGLNETSPLRSDDEFRLSEWLDHAVSASANGAGSVIWREAMLLRRFGADYPLSREDSEAFFTRTPKSELAQLARDVIVQPLRQAGLDPSRLVQGSFWTRGSKARVPGGQSTATPRELARYMLRMEQGRLVDVWSSLEIKKYLYVSRRRYRYIFSPELATSATFFKSGSLYQCRSEEGFRCGKYMGNVRNLMNSVTLVETPPGDAHPRRYIATLLSNVLRVNSAWDHSSIGAAVHQMMRGGRVQLREEGAASAEELKEVGRGL